jgi:hypothetical protein
MRGSGGAGQGDCVKMQNNGIGKCRSYDTTVQEQQSRRASENISAQV